MTEYKMMKLLLYIDRGLPLNMKLSFSPLQW